MGAPSRQQIDDAIADGLARNLGEDEIVKRLSGLERLSDEELAAMGIFPAEVAPPETLPPAPDFAPVPVRRRHDGWTACRQRAFIAALAETGCISEACAEVGITPRSAYRLRQHPDAEGLPQGVGSRAIAGRNQAHRDGVGAGDPRRPRSAVQGWRLGRPTAQG